MDELICISCISFYIAPDELSEKCHNNKISYGEFQSKISNGINIDRCTGFVSAKSKEQSDG
jgi:hypothetical protein